jgi:hypothetical protein
VRPGRTAPAPAQQEEGEGGRCRGWRPLAQAARGRRVLGLRGRTPELPRRSCLYGCLCMITNRRCARAAGVQLPVEAR